MQNYLFMAFWFYLCWLLTDVSGPAKDTESGCGDFFFDPLKITSLISAESSSLSLKVWREVLEPLLLRAKLLKLDLNCQGEFLLLFPLLLVLLFILLVLLVFILLVLVLRTGWNLPLYRYLELLFELLVLESQGEEVRGLVPLIFWGGGGVFCKSSAKQWPWDKLEHRRKGAPTSKVPSKCSLVAAATCCCNNNKDCNCCSRSISAGVWGECW